MNINLKLKKRREIINKEKSHQRIKVIRQYKQQMANDSDLNNNNYKDTNQKYDDYKLKEEERLNYEKKLYGEDINEDNEIIDVKNEKKIMKEKSNKKEKKEDKKYMGNKRSREEIEEEKNKKINKRKKNYRNLHKTNKFGQPLMKYQIANLFDKIKKKKREGII